MKRIFILTVFFLGISVVYPQTNDTVAFRNAVTFNLEALIVKDIKLTYSHRLGKKNFGEAMVSYSIPFSEDNPMADNYFLGLKDPSFYYGRTQFRIGYKQYFGRRFYLGASALYGKGHFERKDAWYHGDKIHHDITRTKNEYGFILKTGFTFFDRFLIQDIYLGIGYRYKILYDTVFMTYYGDTNYPGAHPDYPYDAIRKYGFFTYHLGYQIGYAK